MLKLFSMDIAGLGRIDPSALTDQHMMELFFVPKNFEDSRKALLGDEDDACSWNDVLCDEANQIIEIDWHSMNITLEGSINFPMMPRHLQHLTLYDHKLIGEVDTTNLPESLEYFCIEECFFTGTLDLGSLPRNMKDFLVMDNKITGLINFCNLPPGMLVLNIYESIQKGVQIYIARLPKSLEEVNLEVESAEVLQFEEESDRDRVVLNSRSSD